MMTRMRHWFVMFILCFSGGIIFMLPFLREVYYLPMQEAFGYDNLQMGVIMSVFGTTSLITYFPGGWLADRVSSRKLISSSLLATGLAGAYFATFPSYTVSIIIHGFWGICVSLVFWNAMIKATREWAPVDQQGRAFGILESGRGISELISSTVFLAVFAWLGSNNASLSNVITLFALTNIVLAILAWLILEDNSSENTDTSKNKVGFNEVIEVLKMPVIWLISIVVLTAYSAYWGTYYFAPYATDIYGLSVVLGASVAVGKMWLKPVAAFSAGFVADKVGVSKTVFGFFLIMTISFIIFSALPGGDAFLIMMLLNATLASIAVFALRGIYFALLEEGGVAPAVTGTAAGVISAIGFTPDVFMPLLGGAFLDNYPGAEGYRYFYGSIAVMCAIGTLSAYIIMRKTGRTVVMQEVEAADVT
ncbi:MAG: MFS transporter [Gammaproteobacteria bacterium]|nr:MFS transporter [Gammaproteobacteria bacterium]